VSFEADCPEYAIKVYKQYFNFACAHFMIFKDGSREPLHGHNYRVQLKALAPKLEGDMVFDFLNIKPIVRKICDSLDHKLLLQGECPDLSIHDQDQNWKLEMPDKSFMSIPKTDALILPILNTSVERIAIYLAQEIDHMVFQQFKFRFSTLEIEVEETPGQSAVYTHTPKHRGSLEV
jgi:6-pyruvoyltetrahydropterin/6-carboxytetrahydropterin synthase